MLEPESKYVTYLLIWGIVISIEVILSAYFGLAGRKDRCLQRVLGIDSSIWLIILVFERIFVSSFIILSYIASHCCFSRTRNRIANTIIFILFDIIFNCIWCCQLLFLLFGNGINDCLSDGNAMTIFSLIDITVFVPVIFFLYSRILKYLWEWRKEIKQIEINISEEGASQANLVIV